MSIPSQGESGVNHCLILSFEPQMLLSDFLRSCSRLFAFALCRTCKRCPRNHSMHKFTLISPRSLNLESHGNSFSLKSALVGVLSHLLRELRLAIPALPQFISHLPPHSFRLLTPYNCRLKFFAAGHDSALHSVVGFAPAAIAAPRNCEQAVQSPYSRNHQC